MNPKFIDMNGVRVGQLEIIKKHPVIDKHGGIKWICLCDCGKECIVYDYNLRNGTIKSCGHLKSNDLIGRKFGRLLVVSKTNKHKDGCFVWECICDCGNKKEVKTNHLTCGNVKSCGCLYKKYDSSDIALIHREYNDIKNVAKKKSMEFTIAFEDFSEMIKSNCYYCDSNNKYSVKRKNGQIGYIITNIVPCCKDCMRKHTKETKEKLRKSNTGKRHTDEVKERMSQEKFKNPPNYWLNKKRTEEVKDKISHTKKKNGDSVGEKNPAWKGGLAKLKYPRIFNKTLKLKIRTRDNFICILCGKTEEEELVEFGRVLCVNHIDFNKNNCDEQNLNTLCLSCNTKINSDREKWTLYFKNINNV